MKVLNIKIPDHNEKTSYQIRREKERYPGILIQAKDSFTERDSE